MEASDHARAEKLAAAAGIRPDTSSSYSKAVDDELQELAIIEDERPDSADRQLVQDRRPRSPVRTPRIQQTQHSSHTHACVHSFDAVVSMICFGLMQDLRASVELDEVEEMVIEASKPFVPTALVLQADNAFAAARGGRREHGGRAGGGRSGHGQTGRH